MEDIFLQDYASNVAQAQDPYGIAAVQAQPSFENYTPSFENQSITPFGLAPNTEQIPQIKQVLGDMAMNTAKNYALNKVGLEGIKGNILSSVIGANPYMQGVATLGTSLTGGSLNISNFLKQKRAEKSYEMNQKRMQNALSKSQTQAIQNRLDSQTVSNQDAGRGGAQVTSSPTPSASTQSRQTSGAGGLHSGY